MEKFRVEIVFTNDTQETAAEIIKDLDQFAYWAGMSLRDYAVYLSDLASALIERRDAVLKEIG